MYEEIRATLAERIERGATLEEIETIVLMSKGLRPEQRRDLWLYAWGYAPAPVVDTPPVEVTLH